MKVKGKGGIWPPAPQKNLNRWPPKFMWVTTSMISTKCKIVYKSVQVFQFFACVISRLSAQSDSAIFWSLRKATAETRAPILTQNTSNDAFPRKEVPFGVAKPQSKVSTPIFPKNGAASEDPESYTVPNRFGTSRCYCCLLTIRKGVLLSWQCEFAIL